MERESGEEIKEPGGLVSFCMWEEAYYFWKTEEKYYLSASSINSAVAEENGKFLSETFSQWAF